MRPRKICVFVLSAMIVLSGCAARQKQVTNLPANVTLAEVQSWDAAVANLHKIAEFTSTARQTVIAFNRQGVFPDGPAYAITLQTLGKIDEIQLSASTVLKQSPNNFSGSTRFKLKEYMDQISAQVILLNANGVTGIKNDLSQQQVGQIISQITGMINLILLL